MLKWPAHSSHFMPIFNANAIPDLLSSDNDGNIEHKPIVIEQHEPFCLFNTHLVCWLWVKMHFFCCSCTSSSRPLLLWMHLKREAKWLPCIWRLGWINSSESSISYWEILTVYFRKLWQEILLYFPMLTLVAHKAILSVPSTDLKQYKFAQTADGWHLYVGHIAVKKKRSLTALKQPLI